jgi:hypothetical protein
MNCNQVAVFEESCGEDSKDKQEDEDDDLLLLMMIIYQRDKLLLLLEAQPMPTIEISYRS